LRRRTANPLDLPDRDAAIEWIIDNQLGRRNLPSCVKGELALRKEAIIAQRAKESQVRKPKNFVRLNSAEQKSSIDTNTELSKAAGVSRDTMHKIKKLVESASEETKAALRRGETSINAEYKKATVHVGR
jgi:hypothetical protein